ncbi:MAG: CopG family transcriptional regulator [Pseudomonadota bacterium]|nr:CopG family transcriptional regulator [Pseudomonadota bacterium]
MEIQKNDTAWSMLPADLRERLDGLSKRTGRSVASYLEESLRLCLQDFEDECAASEIVTGRSRSEVPISK